MNEVCAFYGLFGLLFFLVIIFIILFLLDYSRYMRIRNYCKTHGYKYQSQSVGMPECLQNYNYNFDSKIFTDCIRKKYCAIMSGKYKDIDFNIIECVEFENQDSITIKYYSQIFLLSKDNKTLHEFYERNNEYQYESNGKAYLAYYKTREKFEAEDRMYNLDWLSNDFKARILAKSIEDKLLNEIKLDKQN